VKKKLSLPSFTSKKEDLTILGIECYFCKEIGHLAIDCSIFNQEKGNMRELYLKKMKEDAKKLDINEINT
jgi:hypothetical protein